ncbi:hypothetical protein GOODEAATRI_025301, partial [Goodea atripinnis]
RLTVIRSGPPFTFLGASIPEPASNLFDICSRSYLVIRDRPLSRPVTDTDTFHFPSAPAASQGTEAGPGPCIENPLGESKTHHHHSLSPGNWRAPFVPERRAN